MTPGCGMGTSKAAGTMQTAGKVVRYCKCVWPNRRWLKVDSSLCHGVLSKGGRRREQSEKRMGKSATKKTSLAAAAEKKIKTYKEFSID